MTMFERMAHLEEIHVAPESVDRFDVLQSPERKRAFDAIARETRNRMSGRTWWNVNSAGRGGGVAEMLRSLIAYARGAGVDARWLVMQGRPEFFRVTKRLHHAIHGSAGDGSPLGDAEREIYERVAHENAAELLALIRSDDVVLLHDPQTAGMLPLVRMTGARVFWRCHIGSDVENDEVRRGWTFLRPYLEHASRVVFTRRAYVPDFLTDRAAVLPPAIDAFSAKNQDLAPEAVRAILVHTGLVGGDAGNGHRTFRREDGVPGRVDRAADIMRMGPAPTWETPLVVQVSRWDPLKDPIGVMRGFVKALRLGLPHEPQLVLAGPSARAVADDPEAAETFDQVIDEWRALPEYDRARIHLACLPMVDVEENAAMVNALQRHACVVVQKSLQEGFGLTVTEAMWKGRPVIASAVGGIRDQIEDGVSGVLLADPCDLDGFAHALQALLADPARAERIGKAARARVGDRFLAVRLLKDYGDLLGAVERELSPALVEELSAI